jgi:hypothetical protein
MGKALERFVRLLESNAALLSFSLLLSLATLQTGCCG